MDEQSNFEILYEAIVARLKEIVPAEWLRYIDFDLGQMENYNPQAGGKPKVTFPACLIDFEGFESEEEGEFTERMDGIVLLRLCFEPPVGTDSLTPGIYRTKGIEYLRTENVINKALKGWEIGDDFGYMSRKSISTEKRDDKYRVRQVRYRISFSDKSTIVNEATAPATVKLKKKAA